MLVYGKGEKEQDHEQDKEKDGEFESGSILISRSSYGLYSEGSSSDSHSEPSPLFSCTVMRREGDIMNQDSGNMGGGGTRRHGSQYVEEIPPESNIKFNYIVLSLTSAGDKSLKSGWKSLPEASRLTIDASPEAWWSTERSKAVGALSRDVPNHNLGANRSYAFACLPVQRGGRRTGGDRVEKASWYK